MNKFAPLLLSIACLRELAKLYHEGAAREQIESMEQSISAKYSAGFLALFDTLTAVAKPDAARHDIKVK